MLMKKSLIFLLLSFLYLNVSHAQLAFGFNMKASAFKTYSKSNLNALIKGLALDKLDSKGTCLKKDYKIVSYTLKYNTEYTMDRKGPATFHKTSAAFTGGVTACINRAKRNISYSFYNIKIVDSNSTDDKPRPLGYSIDIRIKSN